MTNNNTPSLEQCANDLVKHLEEREESLKRKQEALSEVVLSAISQARPDASTQQPSVENGTPSANESEPSPTGGLEAGIRALYPNLTDEQIEDWLQAI